jgi:hypothetical protein
MEKRSNASFGKMLSLDISTWNDVSSVTWASADGLEDVFYLSWSGHGVDHLAGSAFIPVGISLPSRREDG